MPEEPSSTDVGVPVVESGGDCNRYIDDARIGAIRLVEVLHPPDHRGVDRGIVPTTLTADGEPLLAIVITRQYISPGAMVRVRPLALAESASAVAVVDGPAADPALTPYRRLDDLTPADWPSLKALFLPLLYRPCEPRQTGGRPVRQMATPVDHPQREAVLAVLRATRRTLGQPLCHQGAVARPPADRPPATAEEER
ncbi:MAG: inorganic diphosphatase [Chloroflexi bacterium]|nr:inorganic diphosphatase [Chloroflexota bacterium]